jgi:RimJ/RimL family protein N-acetyltransferase
MTDTTAIPTLVTGRLTLCPPVMADFEAYAAFVTGPRTTWMGGPHTCQTAWAWFCNDVAQWHLCGMGGLIIRRDGTPIGQVSLTHGPQFPEPELGWMLFDPATEGAGYATEAATALRDWALGPRGLSTIVSYIDPANAPSIRLAQRLGATRDDSAPTPANMPTLVYRYHAEARP